MRQAISHVKHTDKHKCVLLCIEKERQGYECIRPISKEFRYYKEFKLNARRYEYRNTDQEVYYHAIYRRVM